MADGWQLGVDLSQLNIVATIDLPMLAYTYAQLNKTVDGTAADDQNAFAERGLRGDGMDHVGPLWTALRDRLQNILGHTSDTLTTTGQVLVHVVQAYRDSDTAARNSLNSAWRGGPPSLDPDEKPAPGPRPDVVIK